MDKLMNVTIQLKNRRRQKRVSQVEIAQHLNMSASNYRKIENSDSPMSLERFIAICEYLLINPYDMLRDQVSVIDTELLNVKLKYAEACVIELKQNETHLWGVIHQLLKIINPKTSDEAYKIVYPE
jgi:transcriptional regulator with XRE-family HTH domain